MTLKEKIKQGTIPQHVAIIMDGNGRWAISQGNKRIFGHEHGVESVRSVVEGAREVDVKYLTLYAFSKENWGRPQDEVDGLMNLLVQAIVDETSKLKENQVRLHVIGDISSLPEFVQEKLNWSMNELKEEKCLNLVLALSYSSKWEISEAAKKIALDFKDGKISVDDIDDNLVARNLTTNKIPDPELLIRTSGEYRISNFLLWQIAYSELYFTPTLWPDFRKEHLFEAINDYQGRERRFGKTSQQV